MDVQTERWTDDAGVLRGVRSSDRTTRRSGLQPLDPGDAGAPSVTVRVPSTTGCARVTADPAVDRSCEPASCHTAGGSSTPRGRSAAAVFCASGSAARLREAPKQERDPRARQSGRSAIDQARRALIFLGAAHSTRDSCSRGEIQHRAAVGHGPFLRARSKRCSPTPRGRAGPALLSPTGSPGSSGSSGRLQRVHGPPSPLPACQAPHPGSEIDTAPKRGRPQPKGRWRRWAFSRFLSGAVRMEPCDLHTTPSGHTTRTLAVLSWRRNQRRHTSLRAFGTQQPARSGVQLCNWYADSDRVDVDDLVDAVDGDGPNGARHAPVHADPDAA
jgi:hypothetical protein